MRATFTAFLILVVILAGATAMTSYTMQVATKPAAQGQAKTPAATAAPARTTAAPAPARAVVTDADLTKVVKTNCASCHSDKLKESFGNLSLQNYDVALATKNVEVSEKMIRKLRAGMMPPPNAPHPAPETLLALVERIETKIDAAAKLDPNPGTRSFQRLNRAEYKAAVKDLLGLDIDPGNWLPLDTMSGNFDNIADAQFLNPTVLEAYLNAAEDISRMAIGDRNAPDIAVKYANSVYISQNPGDHVAGTPYGTRGGIAVDHVFPADGEYQLQLTFASGRGAKDEKIDFSIDGEQVFLLDYNQATTQSGAAADGRSYTPQGTPVIHVTAGQHHVAAAFVKQQDGPLEDIIRPHDWSYAGGGSGGNAITTLPHIRELYIKGPSKVTGMSEGSPSRDKVFSCRPINQAGEANCAKTIIAKLGAQAFRRPLTAADTTQFMKLYDSGSERGGFEIGIREVLSGMLASPNFVLKTEIAPGTLAPGQKNYRLSDLDLATRLSFFLWGTPPDEQLETLAVQKKLSLPGELDKQVKRMLADPRADSLGSRFAAQWFHLAQMYKVNPDPNYFPNFDQLTADAMKQETITFFNNLVRQNRPLLELYTANYTFLNERLARHYGIPGVAGPEYRKVEYPDKTRRGLLGQGSIEVLTSLAGRTSPVQRGKWVMGTLMGTPPPNPPANVPPLDDTAGGKEGQVLTTRQRMEIHRANPTCARCHNLIDPIGLAMDNFDPTGRFRTRENGVGLDTNGKYYDGTSISNVSELVDALVKRPIPLARTFTENLMEYALGRSVEYYDQPTIRSIVKAAEKDNYPMVSFITGVVNSPAFLMKRAETPVSTDATSKSVGKN
jgi:mono/diheme cytochrome c family protein